MSVIADRESRRFTILEGISKNQSFTEIAEQLGVHRHVVSRDIRKMRYEKDPELKQMYRKRDEFVTANKKMFAQKQDARFFSMTGMTFDEKMFQNMIVFYKPELKKAMNSKNESNTISRLSKNVRRTLVRNKIINHGWNKKYEITPEARTYLNSKQNDDGGEI